jgi:hypothetical protein
MELYEVAAFPAHLVGQPFATVARYLLDVHHALLLALVPPGMGNKGAADPGRRCLLAPVSQVGWTPYDPLDACTVWAAGKLLHAVYTTIQQDLREPSEAQHFHVNTCLSQSSTPP